MKQKGVPFVISSGYEPRALGRNGLISHSSKNRFDRHSLKMRFGPRPVNGWSGVLLRALFLPGLLRFFSKALLAAFL